MVVKGLEYEQKGVPNKKKKIEYYKVSDAPLLSVSILMQEKNP